MPLSTPRRFPGRRRHDHAALLLPPGIGLGVFRRRGMGFAAPSPLAAAISQAEGFGVAGAIPTVANNPGDLAIGDIGYGVMGSANITKFPDVATGYQALQNQINLIASGQSKAGYPANATIAQVSNIYSGSTSGQWGNNVATILGVTPDTPFAAVASGSASAPGVLASSGATSTTPLAGASLSDLLSGFSTGSDTTPLLIGGIAAMAALTYALA